MRKWNNVLIVMMICIGVSLTGCSSKKEEPQVKQQGEAQPLSSEGMQMPPSSAVPIAANTPPAASAAVIEVNGAKFTKAQFDAEMKKKTAMLKAQVPADRFQQLQPELKKQIIDDFVIRTLLGQEIKRLAITATESEVNEAVARVKSTLPPGANFEDLLKKNDMSPEKFRDEIALGVKINKLVVSQPLAKAKPTDKEITKYYQDNKEKFKAPETVHARHILIAKSPGDDEKMKTDKKAKAEALRKQLLDGADFADVATRNSDDPSKSNGGDLGTFSRGQMVKPFEDAAFTQKVNAIGSVVETDFGYHIIQVLERNPPRVIELDSKIKGEIGMFLQQQKTQAAFAELVKKLRAKATIIVSGQ